MPSLHADDTAVMRPCDECSATADLSDRKHGYFAGSSGGSAQPACVPQKALTMFSRIFVDLQPVRCSDFGWAGDVREALAPFALASALAVQVCELRMSIEDACASTRS